MRPLARVTSTSLWAFLSKGNPKWDGTEAGQEAEREATENTPAKALRKPAPSVKLARANLHRWTDLDMAHVEPALGPILSARFDRPAGMQYDARHRVAATKEQLNLSFDRWHGQVANDVVLGLLKDHLVSVLGNEALEGFLFMHQPWTVQTESGAHEWLDWGAKTAAARLLVGFTEDDKVWTSEMLGTAEGGDDNEDVLYPFLQLAQNCILSGTQYGFVYTRTELVAVRFYKVAGDDALISEVGAHWEAIPYAACGLKVMTVSIALLTLLLMSLNPEQRRIDFLQEANEDGSIADGMWDWLRTVADDFRRAKDRFDEGVRRKIAEKEQAQAGKLGRHPVKRRGASGHGGDRKRLRSRSRSRGRSSGPSRGPGAGRAEGGGAGGAGGAQE